MRELFLDTSCWNSPDDLYDSFFAAVGAPKWHGRNFDALHDSICTGSINQIELPYRLVLKNFAEVPRATKALAENFVSLIHEFQTEGCAIDLRLD